MIVRLTGTIVAVTEDSAIIERDGIAREVLTPGYALSELASCCGREITLHTQEFIESNQAGGNMTPRIVGFSYPEDRDFFMRFISVKGIGIRKALKALTQPVRMVATWIENGDKESLTQLPGVGKRAAEMIVAELRGKVTDLATGTALLDRPVDTGRFTQAQRDALELLIAWGDSRGDSERWIERSAQLHPELDSAEDWVKAAYRIKTGVEG